jgi:hypothetical protein
MSIVLFYVGIGLSAMVVTVSFMNKGNDKNGMVAAPFMFYAAAIVAKYIGM